MPDDSGVADNKLRDLGIYNTFLVVRMDGESEVGRKHHGCKYLVLDLAHGPYATEMIHFYAELCRGSHPALAADLDVICHHAIGHQS